MEAIEEITMRKQTGHHGFPVIAIAVCWIVTGVGIIESSASSGKPTLTDPKPEAKTSPEAKNSLSLDVSVQSGNQLDTGQTSPTPNPHTPPDIDVNQFINTSEADLGPLGHIDLAVQDQDVVKVLQMLAIQSQRNILPSSNVSGTISAALYNVDFYEALDAILHTNGFGYIEEGNFIKVYTSAELDQIKARDRRLISRVVRLNYLTATDGLEFIKPLISPNGAVTVSAADAPGFEPTIQAGGEKSWADTDTLVIHDYPEIVAEMVDVLKQLDVRPKQVQIDATILEARLNEDNAWGVDLSTLADFAINEFSSPISVIDDLLTGSVSPSGQAIQTTVGNAQAGSAGVKVGVVTNNVAAFIRALDQVTDTTILARPSILTLNRQSAKLITGAKLGYVSITNTETSSTQTIEFLEVGTQMTVRPFVSDDGFIRLELRPEISEGEVRSTDGFIIPDETTSEVITNVIVPNGKTVVLGGLFKEDTNVSRNQVPGLGNTPVLGAAFKGQDDQVRRSEVIFLIRPTIIKDESLITSAVKVNSDIEHARLGAREGLLPWSRTRLTSSYLRDAFHHLDEGRRDMALWSINMALTLTSTAVEAIRMRNELTSEYPSWYDRGLLHKRIDAMITDQMGKEESKQTNTAEPQMPSGWIMANRPWPLPAATTKPHIDKAGLLAHDLVSAPQNSQ